MHRTPGTTVLLALLLALAPGCGKDEEKEEPAGTGKAAPQADDDWPALAVERVKDLLGQGAPLLDEKALSGYIQVRRRQQELVEEISRAAEKGQAPARDMEKAMRDIMKQAGFKDEKDFRETQERILAAKMLLLGLQTLNLQLEAAALAPGASGAVEENLKKFRQGLKEMKYRPTLAELRLVARRLEELGP